MKVSDILRVKGNTLYTVTPDEPLAQAAQVMAEKDIGSLVVMELGDLVGMLTFPRSDPGHGAQRGSVGTMRVRSAMDDAPLTCTLETDMDEVRRMMLDRHARYMPVMDKRMLMGVISFYDVAKAVVDSQNFETRCSRPTSATGLRKTIPRPERRGCWPGAQLQQTALASKDHACSMCAGMGRPSRAPASPRSRALSASGTAATFPRPRPPRSCPDSSRCSARKS